MNRNFFASLPPVDLNAPMHAFFSPEAAEMFGYGIWETADGRLVPVTSAHDNKAEHEQAYGWKDRQDMGIVVRRVGQGMEGWVSKPTVNLSFTYFPEPDSK